MNKLTSLLEAIEEGIVDKNFYSKTTTTSEASCAISAELRILKKIKDFLTGDSSILTFKRDKINSNLLTPKEKIFYRKYLSEYGL